jgi:predicted NAD/FAD-binding protein
MARIAVIGGGISGLATAWLLAPRYQVTLFESQPRLGGHTHTVDASVDGISHPVDTGFIVYNDRTYPNLLQLFQKLGVSDSPSEMSFSVRIGAGSLEWAGTNLAGVFAQPSNLVNPAFLRMLRDLVRFNREATALALSGERVAGSLGDFLDAGRYGTELRSLYLLPMAACIWSTPSKQVNRFPLQTFLDFCHNHGLLALSDRPRWRTVQGGGREYVRRLAARLKDVRLGCPVRTIRRHGRTVDVVTDAGPERFDDVVLATHSDTSLALLAQPTMEERAVLRAIPFARNRAVLHTDPTQLPKRRRAWAAWNFHAARAGESDAPVSLSYLMNRLQPLPFRRPVIVTLNPVDEPRDETILGEYTYDHPVYVEGSDEAKRRLTAMQGRNRTWYAGAWTGFGFHEDGLRSAVGIARALHAEIPW